MSITNKQINIFKQVAVLYLKYADNNTKLYHAVNKINKKTESIQESYTDDKLTIEINAAMVDKDKKLLTNQFGGYEYTKEDRLEVQKKVRELINKPVDLEPHIVEVEELPKSLAFDYVGNDGKTYEVSDYEVRTAFENLVIRPKEE